MNSAYQLHPTLAELIPSLTNIPIILHTLLQLLLVHLLLSPVILVTQLQLYLQLPLFLVMLAPLCLSFTTMLEV